MIPGMNPRQLEKAMRQMGIKQEQIDATEVIIRTPDKEIVITSPDVAKVNMMGKDSYQISGQVHERARETEIAFSEEDVQTVMAQGNCSEEVARKALEETGDLAQAILNVNEE